MHFEKLKIHGFGCLRTDIRFVPDKVNLAIADNEMGKSTLVAAILAAFYGIEEDERKTRTKLPHLKNVLPWNDPDKFGVELDFTSNGKKWRLIRDFHAGEVHLKDRKTRRDHADKYHKGRGVHRIGEELIGLTCDDFLKSFYLKQEEIHDIREAGGLTAHVQRVATAMDGEVTSEIAIERLKGALKRYPHPDSKDGITVENALKRYRKSLGAIRTEMERLERERSEIEPECERLAEIEEEIVDKKEERGQNQDRGYIAEIRELIKLVEAQENLIEEAEQLTTEAKSLKEYVDFPAGKWDQLNKLTGRVEELEDSTAKQRQTLKAQIEEPIKEIEQKLQSQQDLAGISESDLEKFESSFLRLSDRTERYRNAMTKRDEKARELAAKGFNEDDFLRKKEIFDKMSEEEINFVDDFRITYAEEEAVYREAKTQREWLGREYDQIGARRNRTISNSRLFLIVAAVMAIAGGLMMLLTQGGWLGLVLAGLGIVFCGTGLIIRSTAGSKESSGMNRAEIDLEVAIAEEDEIRQRMDNIGSQLTTLATGSGLTDGNQIIEEYTNFVNMEKLSEPFFEAEREVSRSLEETDEAFEQVRPHTERVGMTVDKSADEAVDKIKELLERYKNYIKLGEDYKNLKSRLDRGEEELQRLTSDLESHRELAGEILALGGVDEFDSLQDAVPVFKESLDKHLQYSKIIEDKLPRIEKELLDKADLKAKRGRLEQLQSKITGNVDKVELTHSKEYYRDQAERCAGEIETLNEDKIRINRSVGTVYDRYQVNYPKLSRDTADLEAEIENVEQFQSEIDTAISMMSEISREVYSSWANALSETTAPFLKALNPRYDRIEFNDQLNFVIHDSVTDRDIHSDIIETTLSSGARDEVFLAARLGISSYLSQGATGQLPIILDEPLAAVDDDKFLTGMKFFLEVLAKKHQVLIMSCHAERHRWLAEQAPRLFKRRVHQIEVTSQSGKPGK